jgi:hypothetical protein
MEDKRQHYTIMGMLMPLARSPMDKKSGKALQQYQKDVERMLSRLTPWIKGTLSRRRLQAMGVEPGTVKVILEGGDSADDPLYKGAETIRSK